MNPKLQLLEQWGCDIKGSLPRFLNDEEFMLECITEVSKDPAFDALESHLLQNEVRQAFDAAHTLKGIISNTGLTPLCRYIVTIVEPLRGGSAAGLLPRCEELQTARQKLISLLKR